MTVETPDITELVQSFRYFLVYHWQEHNIPDENECLDRLSSITCNIGSAMCYHILPFNTNTGEIIFFLSCGTLQKRNSMNLSSKKI